ncbi:hypothetical protein KAU39_03010 [bacterium]|nr:hypothetical protein [bacterium]
MKIMKKQSINLKKFRVQLGFIAIAIVLIMYLAKVWFVDHICLYRQQTEMGKTADSIPVISWQKAANHYGEYVAVEGTVVATYNSGKACFLNFHQDYKRHFTAVIFESSFSFFPLNPERFYQGKKVCIFGYIKEYKGKPEIILNKPEQIKILK